MTAELTPAQPGVPAQHAQTQEPRGIVFMIGAAAIDAFRSSRELYSVFVRTIYFVFRGRREKGAVVKQMYEMGNKSLFFLSCTMGFMGMILVYQAGLQSQRVIPDLSLLGATYLELLVRDFAASLGCLMLATRVGAGIAAEIGSMVVTEQVDALRMCAADPIDFLLVPRFLGSLFMTTILIIWAGILAYVVGAATAYFTFGVNPHTFFNASLVDWGDITVGLTKTIAYGAAIPIVSGYSGLSTFGGSEGVGWATTRAVVNSSLAIILLNFLISSAGLFIFPG